MYTLISIYSLLSKLRRPSSVVSPVPPILPHSHAPIRLLIIVMMISSLSGCAILNPNPTALDVPFSSQSQNLCGVAALKMVLAYHGLSVSTSNLVKEVHIPTLKGTIPALLAEAARKQGLQAGVVQGNSQSLTECLTMGIPPIVFFGPPKPDQAGHFVVVTALSNDGARIRLHDVKKNQWMPIDNFETRWREGRHTMVVIKNVENEE